MEFREKQKFFSLRPQAQKRKEISGWVQWVKWCPHIGQQMHCWQTVAAGPFWPCFACPKLGDAGKMRVASKNRAVLPKTFRPQFSDVRLAVESAIFHIYQNFLSGGFRSKVKIVTAQLFVTPPYFCWQLAFYRHLPTSGRQNTVKTAPQPLFVNSESISVHPTRRQIFAGKTDTTFPNIWEWVLYWYWFFFSILGLCHFWRHYHQASTCKVQWLHRVSVLIALK